MKVLFVGPVSGYSSYPVVCKGLIYAMVRAGITVTIADTTSDGSEEHTISFLNSLSDARISWLDHREALEIVQQGKVEDKYGEICIAFNPTHHLFTIKDSGVKVVGMHVGDVDRIPNSWKTLMAQEELVLTPSNWCKQIMQKEGVQTPIMVLNHGIGHDFINYPLGSLEEELRIFNGLPFSFLHLCAAVFYPERKSTPQVLKAFERLIDEDENVLLKLVFGLKTRPVKTLARSIPRHVREHVILQFNEGSRPQEEIAKIYKSSHVLLAPSRAEGMGMCPIEARALGVPVIQTLCTGHADHYIPDDSVGYGPVNYGVAIVKHGDMVPAWGNFGKAPEVTVDSVYEAMKVAQENWENLKMHALRRASEVREMWSWEAVTQPLIGWIKAQ
jgi:glycosyltransferase involved in cell wall biosynthesis